MSCGDYALALYGYDRFVPPAVVAASRGLVGYCGKRCASGMSCGDYALALYGHSRVRASGGAVGPLSGGPLPTPALQGLCP